MIQINLREFYPTYQHDISIEVTEEIVEQLRQWELSEKAHQRKRMRYRAQYSLDRSDGIEYDFVFAAMTPNEYYERKLLLEQLYQALAQLPEKQSRRICAYYFMGITFADIAKAEEVKPSSVQRSVSRGLLQLAKILNKAP